MQRKGALELTGWVGGEEQSGERGYTPSVDTGRRGVNCERRITGVHERKQGREKKRENERQ